MRVPIAASTAVSTLCALAVLAVAPPLRADDVPEAGATATEYERVTASAIEDFNQGLYVEARALFERAHSLQPSARTFRALGLASFELRHYVRAIRELSLALEDHRRPLTDAMREEVRRTLDRCKAYVATLELKVSPSFTSVKLDDEAVLPGSLTVDPGERRVAAAAEGYHDKAFIVNVEGGKTHALDIALERVASSPEQHAAWTAADSEPKESPGVTSRWWFWTGLAVLAVGAATVGVVALADKPHDTDRRVVGNAGITSAP
jgi:tetratricopeptide (TPR) repeat protein